MKRLAAPLVALALVLPGGAAAQSSEVMLAEGIAAYRDLSFAAAMGLLQRALSPAADPPLADDQRLRALMYLGAAQLFADRADQATATFRTLVIESPGYRPDAVVFPPRVTAAFREVRTSTQAVRLAVPARRTVLIGDSVLPIRIQVSSPHFVTVVLEDARGRSLATIFDGLVTQTQAAAWDGRDADQNVVPEGRYLLRAVSAVTAGTALRSVAVPLTVRHLTVRTVPAPAFPSDQLLPERVAGANRPLVVSALALGAVILAPAIAGDTDHTGPRIVIGGLMSVGGIVELVRGSSSAPIAENQAHNRRVRREHEREVAEVRRLNRQRARMVRLDVRAGPPERREGR